MSKPRILWVNEASYLATGYSTYGKEVMLRLLATDKYELAEMASYGHKMDQRSQSCPWKFYGVLPDPNDIAGQQHYSSNPMYAFGELVFEQTVLDFKPDIIVSIRDVWMDEFIERSPFRRMYHWIYMPTVDSEPQMESWLSTFMNADGLFTYSKWGLDLLKQQCGDLAKLYGVAAPGADINTFKPQNKAETRAKFGLTKDLFLIGTVMRNQKRKLYPNLMRAFNKLLAKVDKETAEKLFLYFHISYPDVGWDIASLIKRYGLSRKVLVTYLCRNCNSTFCHFFSDARTICKNCQKPAAFTPNTQLSVTREALADIINMFDVYVQYASAEGFGMPQVEAAACGVPVFSTDYSAMASVVREVKGFPIKVSSLEVEAETGLNRAIPDDNDLVEKILTYMKLSQLAKDKKCAEIRDATVKKFTWDNTAKIWEGYFDSVKHRADWAIEPDIRQPNLNMPQGMNNDQFVQYAIMNVICRPDLLNSYLHIRLLRDLNNGFARPPLGGYIFNENTLAFQQPDIPNYTREKVIEECVRIRENINKWESIRIANVKS